jgi:predicted transcriptional regulator
MGTIQKMVVANINYGVGYQLVKKLKEKDLITYERPRKRILNLRLTKEGSELVSSMTPIIKLCEEVLRKDTDKEN